MIYLEHVEDKVQVHVVCLWYVKPVGTWWFVYQCCGPSSLMDGEKVASW